MPVIKTNTLDVKAPLDGWRGRFFHSVNMTFAYYDVDAGASIHEHHHPEEEVWNIVEGEFEITLDGEVTKLSAGDAAVVPGNVSHFVRAITEGKVIVVDHPVRASVGGVSLI